MAEIVVSAVISVLCEKLISGDFMKLARSEGIASHLNKWNNTLPLIQAVLADAGQKQITARAVRLWLNRLQGLAYDIDDVLDDLATEAMRRQLNHESLASTRRTSKVLKIIPTCCTTFTPRNLMYGQRMSSKLDEITIKLHDLAEVKTGLGLNVNVERSNRTQRRLEQTSVVDEHIIMGREGDSEALLEKLLGYEALDRTVSIVSIIGMGGIGKTTLAKFLYNKDSVMDHFELRAWVCVSEQLEVFNISKAIFQAITLKNRDFANLDMLHVALKERLSGRRFLLVLDDVWNEDQIKWDLLKSPLVVGQSGSIILVTTRNMRVASVMDSDEAYHLKLLSNEDALSLFAQHALGERNFDNHPTLVLHGEGIVKKCGGLPLALKTLGRLLKGNKNGDEWEKLLNSEILPKDLRLSYYNLPPHLKLLFTYCALFPKGYVFDKKELILLWMGEGFLSQLNDHTPMESLGNQYFEELKSRSFFQHSTSDELRYTMHGLTNDLATSVAGECFFRLDDEMEVSIRNGTCVKSRHFSLIGPRCGSYRKLKELHRARHMRTFLLLLDGLECQGLLDKVLADILPGLQYLRVLSLRTPKITEVPQSIGRLMHLRYLNFSFTAITCLPEQVSDLYNLQSLLLHGCYRLSGLPKSFVKLINLRHLDITDTPKVNKMPLGIGGLTSLQTLTKVIVDGADGFKLSELQELSDLQGQLYIKGLDKVKNPIQAQDANIYQKKGLDVLEMEWSDVFDDSRNELVEYEILERLRPHHKLRTLKILYYKGTRFPSWVGDPSFDRLTELTLCGCTSTHLPTLGRLKSLGKLIVTRMKEVMILDFELFAPTSSFGDIAFPSLEFLEFDDMQGWQRWSTSGNNDDEPARSFPRLREISIKRCPKLVEVAIGSIPSLRALHIEECSAEILRSMIGLSSSLFALRMSNVKGLTELHGQYLRHLVAVQHLHFDNCHELRYLWLDESESCSLASLPKLEVHNCVILKSIICPNGVERLVISNCDSMESLTFSIISDNLMGLLPLICLRSLHIHNCNNLNSFLHERLESFTCLEELRISDCPSLDYTFPCGFWPPNLRSLTIGCLNKPMSEWGLQNFPTSLVELILRGKNSGVVSFAVAEDVRNDSTSSSFLLPSSLASLELDGFTDVESLSLSEALQRLPCLERLHIQSCPKLRDLFEPTYNHLSSFTVTVCD
ncbi:hypothetical protein Lser_V15G03293 [Lactuca serriola]